MGIKLSEYIEVVGGSPGLVVVERDSCSNGHEFESRYRILDGHFFTYIFVVKFVAHLNRQKLMKRGRVGPFLKRHVQK